MFLAPGASPLTRQTRHAGFTITGHRVVDPANPVDESLPCTHTSIGFTLSGSGGDEPAGRIKPSGVTVCALGAPNQDSHGDSYPFDTTVGRRCQSRYQARSAAHSTSRRSRRSSGNSVPKHAERRIIWRPVERTHDVKYPGKVACPDTDTGCYLSPRRNS